MISDSRILLSVADLQIGMYVCELDRPWLELPFEEPFKIQGFFIRTVGDIDKVRRYCSHVYVDSHHSSPDSLGNAGIRTTRTVSQSWLEKLTVGLRRMHPGASVPNRKTLDRGGRSRSENTKPESRRKQSSDDDYRQLLSSKSDTQLPTDWGILAENTPDRVVYQNQTSLEEEYYPAKHAITDAEAFYGDLVNAVQKDEEVVLANLEARIDALIRSVIRNPDALSYLVHLKSHSKRTYNLAISSCVISMSFGRHLGLSGAEIRALGIGALMHDVGMIKLPAEMLDKPGPLSEVENKLVQRHVSLSRGIMSKVKGATKESIDICYLHHERYDGSGYPLGLKGDQIPLFAMIMGIVDTYMSLSSFRPYRPGLTSFDALTALDLQRNDLFVGALVDRFIQTIAIFPVGSFVQLNSGHIGVVVDRNPMHNLEPKVMLVQDPHGNEMARTVTINFAAKNKPSYFQGLKILGEIVPGDFGIEAERFFV